MSARLAMLDQLIEKGSQDPFVHYARAIELRSLGREDDALAALQAVRARFPDYAPTYLIAGQLAAQLRKSALARELFSAGLSAARRAGDAHAVSELSTALQTLGAEDG